MTAIVLVLAVGVWGTMAYLSTLSNKKENTFTGSKGIALKLTEPYWDETPGADDGVTDLTELGKVAASSYTPGTKIGKNPILTNSSTDADSPEWVVLAVSYTIGNKAVSYTQLKYLIEKITFNTTAADDGYWIAADPLASGTLNEDKGYMIYLYSKVLAKDAATKPLFTSVTIKSSDDLEGSTKDGYVTDLNTALGITTDDQKYKINGNLPDFQIDVIGAAIKNEYKKDGASTAAEAWADLAIEKQTELTTNLVGLLTSKLSDESKTVGTP